MNMSQGSHPMRASRSLLKKKGFLTVLAAAVMLGGFFALRVSAMDAPTAPNQSVPPIMNPFAKGPLNVYGSVKIDGVPAPVGTHVGALLGNAEFGSTTVTQAGEYNMSIICGDLVFSAINLRVNGQEAASNVNVENTRSIKYDLSITGQGGSGGSGGGSGTGGANTNNPGGQGSSSGAGNNGNNPANGNPGNGQAGNNNGGSKGATGTNVADGSIIQCKSCANPFAVYIVKIVNGKKFIRHIVSLQIFNHYKHLQSGNLIQVDSLDGFSHSGLVRVNTCANGNPGPSDKVYEINGDQTRHWIDMTAAGFLQHGGSDNAIYSINQGELDLYKQGSAVKLQ
jgi:hypothetical protein